MEPRLPALLWVGAEGHLFRISIRSDMADDRVCITRSTLPHDEEQNDFWAAIKEGDLAEVERLFIPERASRPGFFGCLVIHYAVVHEQLDVVKLLCEKGVDITAKQDIKAGFPTTPLMLANDMGNEEIIAFLKEQLALSQPTYRDGSGRARQRGRSQARDRTLKDRCSRLAHQRRDEGRGGG